MNVLNIYQKIILKKVILINCEIIIIILKYFIIATLNNNEITIILSIYKK